ncbi:cell wall hydrolase [Enterocloster clostridioformis]|nr:cell wall hydrolase [Lachnoclostridium sp. YL32]NDO29470.1 cell wall hydrolase [Enterocloster clostridioformis]OXE61931.1 cell wall hydrolase [Enterocloster clostridioformis]QQR01963.1 cell wall hydrolase [Enterocloster clostridioformis]
MGKKQSSFHMGDEFNGNGEIRYLKGTQPGLHPPMSQENVHLTPDFGTYLLKVLGSMPAVINPIGVNPALLALLGSMASVNKVIITKDSVTGNYIFKFNVTSNQDLTDGSYPYTFHIADNQIPAAMGVLGQWVEAGEPLGSKWKYYRDGTFIKDTWVESNGQWYYVDSDSFMMTGWFKENGDWYYLKSKKQNGRETAGHMAKHWLEIEGTWYYFHSDGKMAKSVWRQDEAKKHWYYLRSNGKMAISQVRKHNGKLYYLKADGAMAVNEEITDPDTGITYWANDKGELTEGAEAAYSEEDYNYLVALGTECPTYDGFLAVAYSVINRADEHNQSIREVVTAKNQYGGFRNSEIGKPKNEDVKQAAIDALSGAVPNPIGKATFFFGRVNNYDIWYESTKCHYIKEVDKNVFYVSEDYGYVHNMSSSKTSDAVVIYSSSQGKWLKRGLIVN